MTRNTRIITSCVALSLGLGCASAGSDATNDAALSTGNTPAASPVSGSTPAQTATAQGQAAMATPTTAVSTSRPASQAQAAVPNSMGAAGSAASSMAQAAPTTALNPAQPAAAASTAASVPAAPAAPAELDHTKDIRGSCNLKTMFPDDQACIAAPKPGEGFQIHVGPASYDDPAEVAKFIIKPGEERTECYTFRTTNEQELTFQTATLSGRSGTHHIINTVWSGDLPTGGFTEGCGTNAAANPFAMNAPMQIGSLPGASKAYMERRKVAPEFADVGRVIPAKALVTSDMHYYNFTDKDILREYWINVYYPPAEAKITRYAKDIAAFGGLGWNNNPIQPGTDMVYKYECPIVGNGFIINLLGHYHVHGRRFGMSIKRKSGMIEKVFEMYDPQDPAIFDYNSITMNPAFSSVAAGATSGILPVSDGDTFQWECHIVNDSKVALGYTNKIETGEMCNAWGFSVGIDPLQCGVL